MSITLYGIKNCDTVKKARTWLDGHGCSYRFHDFKAEGVDKSQIERWIEAVGWEKLLNRAGTTFRKLPEGDKAGLTEETSISLMMAHPTIIKRPVLEQGELVLVGFKPEIYEASLGHEGNAKAAS